MGRLRSGGILNEARLPEPLIVVGLVVCLALAVLLPRMLPAANVLPQVTLSSSAPEVVSGGPPSDAAVNAWAGSFSPAPPVCAVKAFVQANSRLPQGVVEFVNWSAENGLYDTTSSRFTCSD